MFDPWDDSLDKEMATHSSILVWRIPWPEEPGRLQSTGSHDWAHTRNTAVIWHCFSQFFSIVWVKDSDVIFECLRFSFPLTDVNYCVLNRSSHGEQYIWFSGFLAAPHWSHARVPCSSGDSCWWLQHLCCGKSVTQSSFYAEGGVCYP